MDGTQHGKNEDIFVGRDTTRVPFKVYEDEEIYRLELERIFYASTWNYVGLDCEVPNPGDFRRNFIGEREVLMIRNEDGEIAVVENRCAHRGAQICQALEGNAGDTLMCPYHQWTYSLDGDLQSVPFRRGYKGQGGFPEDFDMSKHGLSKLKVENVNGVVFASFNHNMKSVTEELGPDNLHYFTRVFDGSPLRIVGYQRQVIDSNWKLQMENLRDPYHAGILHLFLISFGLFRLDQKSAYYFDDGKGHTVLMTERGTEDTESDYGGVKVAAPDYKLTDHELVQPRKEFPDDVTLAIQTLFPSIIVQAQSNTLATRHVIPKGPGSHELIWTFFGFEDDDEEMHTLRLRQANLMGSAGYVTLDDAEALEFSQRGLAAAPEGTASVLEIDGKDAQSGDCLVTEALIRGFYMRYREIMGFEKAVP